MHNKSLINTAIIIVMLGFLSCLSSKAPLKTVESVDLNKYSGKWHEIASIPMRFQKGCFCTTAEYQPTDKGYIKVINKCNRGSQNGNITSIEGKAFVKDKKTNAKLSVQFFWPLRGKYWIIGLADDYSWAIVGNPSRKSLWILARTPQIDQILYQELLLKVKSMGYDISLIKQSPQCY